MFVIFRSFFFSTYLSDCLCTVDLIIIDASGGGMVDVRCWPCIPFAYGCGICVSILKKKEVRVRMNVRTSIASCILLTFFDCFRVPVCYNNHNNNNVINIQVTLYIWFPTYSWPWRVRKYLPYDSKEDTVCTFEFMLPPKKKPVYPITYHWFSTILYVHIYI